jgi:RecB family exonuclease
MTGPQVYLERFGPPARERLQCLVAEAKAADPLAPVTVIPPSHYAGISLRHVLAGDAGLLNVRFMVAARLAEYLGAPVMADQGRRPMSGPVELAAVRAVAGDATDLVVLGPVARHPSLHRALRSTFRDLASLGNSELEQLDALEPLQEDTARLFRRFREKTGGYYHQEDMAAAAAEAVRSGATAAALRDIGAVIFCLTAEFSPAETDLAHALADASSCSLVIGLTGEDEVDAASRKLAESFGGVCGGVCVDGTVPATGRAENAGDLGYEVHGIVSAPDVREEVRRAVRDMLRAASDGVPFHRMAALYRQADPYAHQLQTELKLAGIPIAGPAAVPVQDSAPGRLLLGLLDVIEDDFGRARLMQWLAEAPVSHGSDDPSGDFSAAELMSWERVSREAGVVRGLHQWNRLLEPLARQENRASQSADAADHRGETSPAQARAARKLAAASAGLLAFIKGLTGWLPPPDGSKWRDFSDWGKMAFEHYASRPQQWPEEQQTARERVIDILDQLRELDDVEEGATLANFRQALENALSVPAGRSGATGGGVFTANINNAQGMEFDALWIFGMAEGVFPPRSREDPLLPDSARRELGEEKFPLRLASSLEERRVYLAALAAGKRRFLSYARTDPGARRGQHPARWLLDAASLLSWPSDGGPPENRVSSQELTQIGAAWLSVVQSPEHSLQDAAGGAAADGHEYDLESLAKWRQAGGRVDLHSLAEAGSTLGRALAMNGARGSRELSEWDGYVGGIASASPRLSGALTRVVSPTRLESWARCPFQFFLGNVLDLSAWDTPEDVLTLSPLERGNLVHAILERFIEEAVESGPPGPGVAWTDSDTRRLNAIAEEEFNAAERKGITGRRVMWESVKEEVRRELETFLEKDAERRAALGVLPWQAELRFGFDDSPVLLELPNGERVSFRGMIDRVDVSPDHSRAIVTDYKTGSAYAYRDIPKDPLGRGTHLQLPVYALAVRDGFLPDASIEADYWFVSHRGKFQRIPVALDKVEPDFLETVQTIITGIREGVFPANPGLPGQFDSANCSFCDFRRVCPSGKEARWERKQSSPQALPYTRLAQPLPDAVEGEE